MKGTPRSLWLSWMNRATGWWNSAAVTAMQNQQRAALKAMTKPKPAAKRKPRPKKR
jgi:hypothetical protein